jgi:nicotinate-nucleotide adenylyltransferase
LGRRAINQPIKEHNKKYSMKIGLFFGSFNPVHHGHLIIAQHLINETSLEQVWMVVSPRNPFKQQTQLLDEYQRLHLVHMALDNNPKIKASDIEFHLPKPSYTIDTLIYLEEKYPKHSFSIIMGSDSLQNLSKWKNASILMEKYPVYVYTRPGFDTKNPGCKTINMLDAPLIEISATRVRELIKKNKSLRYLMPDSVIEEIDKCGYYR